MSSSESFVPTLVEDDRLILTSKLPYEVYQGAASVSPQVFASNTATSSSHTYTVTVPSYEVITDMNIMFDGDITYTITGIAPNGHPLVNYANIASATTIDCLAPYPFLQNIIVASATINQSQVSCNVQDVLPALLPCISRDSLSTYNSMTPTMLDNVQSYTANAGYYQSQASVFAPYTNSNDWKVQPRGAYKVTIGGNNTNGDGVSQRIVTVTVHVTEPLGVLSPFLFAKPGAGISGVQAINFNFTMDSAGLRSWRSTAPAAGVGSQSVVCSYDNCKLLVNFLSPKASQLVKYSPRNILPYSQLQVYKSNNIPALATGSINSPSIQLSAIPKMVLAFVRPVNRTYGTADYVLPIKQININFNGRNGLLSGATQQQLYAMSVLSGVNQSWQEWSGAANSGNLAGDKIYTQGGVLALTFGRDVECSNEFDAPGSIGQYNFAINATYDNSCGSTGNIEMYIVFVNAGFLASERGQSSSFISILSKSDTMSVLNDVPISDAPAAQTLPEDGSETLTGGRRLRMHKGMGKSAGGKSGGVSKLHSRLMM